MKYAIFTTVCMALFCVHAIPTIDANSVDFSYNPDTYLGTVHYTLSEAPAVVTYAVETNAGTTAEGPWVKISDKLIARTSGDINQVIRKTGEHAFFWRVPQSLGPINNEQTRVVVKAWATNAPPDYMVINLESGPTPNTVRYFPSEDALPYGGITNDIYRYSLLVCRKVPAANVTFRMGNLPRDISTISYDANGNQVNNPEKPHLVTLTSDFYLTVFPLTSGQYHCTLRTFDLPINNPVRKKPVGDFNWEFGRGTNSVWPAESPAIGHASVERLSVVGHLRFATGLDFDMPTDAQWEFACRAGESRMTQMGTFTNEGNFYMMTNIAWVSYYIGTNFVQQLNQTKEVGKLTPNAWGFYDMLGNAYEFCLDHYAQGDAYSDGSHVTDPVGNPNPDEPRRVVRGGAYNATAFINCNNACRAQINQKTVLDRVTLRPCCPAIAR